MAKSSSFSGPRPHIGGSSTPPPPTATDALPTAISDRIRQVMTVLESREAKLTDLESQLTAKREMFRAERLAAQESLKKARDLRRELDQQKEAAEVELAQARKQFQLEQ
ncbi:MAG: hypothetical protein ACRCZF_12175, partial [Gemmataceae bacterium]